MEEVCNAQTSILLCLQTMKTLIFDLDGTLVQLKPQLVCFADINQLTTLRKQYNFALVSGSPKAEVEWALKETGLKKLFDGTYIVALEDTNSEKASGKPFQEIQKRLQGSMVMIGDSASDEAGSKIAGLPFIRVKPYATFTKQQQALQGAIRQAEAIIHQAEPKEG